jgi:hypothetical protein
LCLVSCVSSSPCACALSSPLNGGRGANKGEERMTR